MKHSAHTTGWVHICFFSCTLSRIASSKTSVFNDCFLLLILNKKMDVSAKANVSLLRNDCFFPFQPAPCNTLLSCTFPWWLVELNIVVSKCVAYTENTFQQLTSTSPSGPGGFTKNGMRPLCQSFNTIFDTVDRSGSPPCAISKMHYFILKL